MTPPDRLIAFWRAVVAQAIQDVCHPELDRPTLDERVDAFNWLMGEGTEQFTYRWVCDMADLEPDEPRRRLREMRII